jgi:hypothetical protein
VLPAHAALKFLCGPEMLAQSTCKRTSVSDLKLASPWFAPVLHGVGTHQGQFSQPVTDADKGGGGRTEHGDVASRGSAVRQTDTGTQAGWFGPDAVAHTATTQAVALRI